MSWSSTPNSNGNLTLTRAEFESCRPVWGEGGRVQRGYCPFHGSDNQRSLRLIVETGRFHCFSCGAWGYMDWAREKWREERGYSSQSPDEPSSQKRRTPNNGSRSVFNKKKKETSSRGPWEERPNRSSGGDGEQMSFGYRDEPRRPSPPRGSFLERANASRGPREKVKRPEPRIPGKLKGKRRFLVEPARADLDVLLNDYQTALKGSSGENYLSLRGISYELASCYGVGYAAPGHWVQDQYGIEWGRVVFPHTDPKGHLINFYARAIEFSEPAPKNIRHRHLSGNKGYFNSLVLSKGHGPLFVCEGAFDALALIAAGFERTIAIYGVHGWRWEWFRGVREIVFALDADQAGGRWRELARTACLKGKRVHFLPEDCYGGEKDPSAAWAAGSLQVHF